MKRYPGQEFPAFLYVFFLILYLWYKGTKKSWITQVLWHFFFIFFQLFLPPFWGHKKHPIFDEITAHSWRDSCVLSVASVQSPSDDSLNESAEKAESRKVGKWTLSSFCLNDTWILHIKKFRKDVIIFPDYFLSLNVKRYSEYEIVRLHYFAFAVLTSIPYSIATALPSRM